MKAVDLNPAERAEYDRLAAWFLDADLPGGEHPLGDHLKIHGPESFAYLRARIDEGLRGQQLRAAFDRLNKLKAYFSL